MPHGTHNPLTRSNKELACETSALQSRYGGQSTLSTNFIKTNHCILLHRQHNTTVSLETNPFIHLYVQRLLESDHFSLVTTIQNATFLRQSTIVGTCRERSVFEETFARIYSGLLPVLAAQPLIRKRALFDLYDVSDI